MADATAAMLRRALASDQSRSVRAAIGMRLPWLLANDVAHLAEWIDVMFGDAVPSTARTAAWDAYLLYSRFFSSEAVKLARQYDLAVTTHEPQPEDATGRRLQTDEHLGIHVAAAYLLDLEMERRGNWLTEFYRRAAGWARARVTRWISEQAAATDATPQIGARARGFLRQRNESADAEADAEELKAVSWIASATDASDEILEILLAALEKTAGATENESGAVALAARLSTTVHVARTVELAASLARRVGFRLRLVDAGGGLGVQYGESDRPLDLERLAERLAKLAAGWCSDADLAELPVLLEPGRFVSAPAGVLVARVLDVKEVGDRTVAILDAGMHAALRPALVGAGQRLRLLTTDDRPKTGQAQVLVAGPLCTGLDVLPNGLDCVPAVGELVAMLDLGAYGFSESMPFFLSHSIPAEVAICGRRAGCIRQRVAPAELLESQQIPAFSRVG